VLPSAPNCTWLGVAPLKLNQLVLMTPPKEPPSTSGRMKMRPVVVVTGLPPLIQLKFRARMVMSPLPALIDAPV